MRDGEIDRKGTFFEGLLSFTRATVGIGFETGDLEALSEGWHLRWRAVDIYCICA